MGENLAGKLLKNKPMSGEKKDGNPVSRFIQYLKDAKAELKKVSWPTKKDTIKGTWTVVIFSVIVAAFLGVLDYFFNIGLEQFIK
ncbi:MAG: preprotein translocase subunit SecE [Patescibacteria group bacterium]